MKVLNKKSKMENREESGFDERTVSFLEEQAVLEVVDSIVSVVSGTLTEGANYGASLYYDPEKGFRHSVDCECLPCMLGVDILLQMKQ